MGSSSVTSLDRSALSGSQVIDCGPSTDARTHLGVILQAVSVYEKGARLSELQRLMSTMLDSLLIRSVPACYFPGYRKIGELGALGHFSRLREQVRQLLYAEIRDRRQYLEQPGVSPAEKTDILTLPSRPEMRTRRDEDIELHDELVTLLLAGHETTSALVWMLYWIYYYLRSNRNLRELADLDPQADPW